MNFTPSPSTGILLYVLGHILVWFQLNSQFKWEWFQDKQVLTTLVISIPMSLCFVFGTRHIVGYYGTLWSSRWVGYGVGIFVFSAMTYFFMGEDLLSWKTLSCLALSLVILLIQVFGR